MLKGFFLLLLLLTVPLSAHEQPAPEVPEWCLTYLDTIDPEVMAIVMEGPGEQMTAGAPPEPRMADCYEAARCFWCALEGAALTAAIGYACYPNPFNPGCALAVAQFSDWVQRCRGTCNRDNYADCQ